MAMASDPHARDTDMITLSADDLTWLGRWTVGGRPGLDWLADDPPADRVRAVLIKWMDRAGTESVFARVLADHLGADRHVLYAENWPRRAARLAADARARGNDPHADKLQSALVRLMFCANCGRPLADPISVERGIGPDCWPRIEPGGRAAIERRLTGMLPLGSAP
jgi:hypothetical protein